MSMITARLLAMAGRCVEIDCAEVHAVMTVSRSSIGGGLRIFLHTRAEAEELLHAVSSAVVMLAPSYPLPDAASAASLPVPVPLCPAKVPEGGVSAGETVALRIPIGPTRISREGV